MRKFVCLRSCASVFVLVVLVAGAACSRTKSSTPLSPSIAGPLDFVTMVAPRPLEPTAGQQVKDGDQPIALLIENAQSNSPRPFSMTVQIAADVSFATVLFTQTGIAPAEAGRTPIRLPSRLQPGNRYFWRTRADDGANSSGWSDPSAFDILQPIVLGTPTPLSPIANALAPSLTPTLVAANGPSSGPHGPLHYNFQVSRAQTFAPLAADSWTPAGTGQTTFITPALAASTTYYWRVRMSTGQLAGAWSSTETFTTPAANATPPSPGPVGPVTGNGGSCASTDGKTIVACIEAKYPSKLAAGVSDDERLANMEFLRDRVIEAGICGGLDLAWNKKRGTGPHSIDALAWRHADNSVDVVDIGAAYDDTSRELSLLWLIVGGPPGYDPYPAFTCD